MTVVLGTRGHFGQILRQFVVIVWIHSGERFSANQAVDSGHDVERFRRIRSWCQLGPRKAVFVPFVIFPYCDI